MRIWQKDKISILGMVLILTAGFLAGIFIISYTDKVEKQVSSLGNTSVGIFPLHINKQKNEPREENAWLDYKNNELGIKIKYPSDWKINLGGCVTPFWGVSENCLRVEDKNNKNCPYNS